SFQAALRRLDVIGRDDELRVCARAFGELRKLERFGERLRAGGGDDGDTALRGFHREGYEFVAFVGCQRAGFAGGAVDEDTVAAAIDLVFDQARVSFEVDFAVLERRNQRRD